MRITRNLLLVNCNPLDNFSESVKDGTVCKATHRETFVKEKLIKKKKK